MNLSQCILTKNECYKANVYMTPVGIMVHSTAANNPYLGRYVPNRDGLLTDNKYNNHWDQPKPDGRLICCHAFIGKRKDESIATYQTLPWKMRGWHGGSGKKGSVNDNYIGFEICEDGRDDPIYAKAVYNEAKDLCVYLCKEYNINPDKIICHAEGYRLGLATNHSDVEHWWPKLGLTMDQFRADVKSELSKTTNTPAYKGLYYVQVGAFGVKENAEAFLAKVKSSYKDAFIKKVGNLYYVQVGAFGVKENAAAYLTEVRKRYPDSFIKTF